MLSALGETINIMTLGGLALAVGILVDDATVEIENINRNLAMGKETVQAILDGAAQIAVPAFVSTLCICIVFIPMFFLSGVAKFLFVPLAEAVIFAMLASYMWSRTIVPTMAMYLLSSEDEYHPEKHAGEKLGFFRRYQQAFERAFERFREGYHALWPRLWTGLLFRGCFLGFCVLSAGLDLGPRQGLLPEGRRRPDSPALPRPHRSAHRGNCPPDRSGRRRHSRHDSGEGSETILDNIGVPYSGINLTYSNSGTFGTSDAEILVQLKPERGKSTSAYVKDLRGCRNFPGCSSFSSPRTSSRKF